MKIHIALLAGLLAASSAGAADVRQDGTIDAKAAFSRLKTLAGVWEATTEETGKARITYELIAAGTSLVERETAEKMPEMMTVYHLDGVRLILTHYCMAGNQPRMQAQSFNPETGEIRFRFLDATNLSKPTEGHMHNATIRVVDDRHLVTGWEFYQDGKPKFTEGTTYTRVK